MKRFNPFDPPDPQLTRELMDTVQAIVSAKPPDHVLHALRCFRHGVIERQMEDQFEDFWHAIETVAEGGKDTVRIPIPCPKCQGPLFCEKCQEIPTRRPMARQAIRQLISRIVANDPEKAYQIIVKTRDHLLHGRSPDLVQAEIGHPLPVIVNRTAEIAWHAIMRAMPPLESTVYFAHRGGNFVHGELVVTPDMQFEYPGDAPHPSEEQIPNVKLSLMTRFRPAADEPGQPSTGPGPKT